MGAVMALTMGSTAMQIYHQNKALEAQGRANVATARSMVSSMNRTFMNYEQQRGTSGGRTHRRPPRS